MFERGASNSYCGSYGFDDDFLRVESGLRIVQAEHAETSGLRLHAKATAKTALFLRNEQHDKEAEQESITKKNELFQSYYITVVLSDSE